MNLFNFYNNIYMLQKYQDIVIIPVERFNR